MSSLKRTTVGVVEKLGDEGQLRYHPRHLNQITWFVSSQATPIVEYPPIGCPPNEPFMEVTLLPFSDLDEFLQSGRHTSRNLEVFRADSLRLTNLEFSNYPPSCGIV
ncbi:hypothetical protein TNCV_4567391 [Trichonephila clavipes]|nr:hypothetical protein TNCV_4567391 [Trichonephila clavipes]